MPVNSHGGTGLPDYGKYQAAALLFITEVPFYSQRAFVQLLFAGVFERFPKIKFVMTEMGCAWLPPMLKHFDHMMEQIRATGRIGEMRYAEGDALPKSATEYFRQCCWVGASQPGAADVATMATLGVDKFMWGSDYPHEEGTGPYTREHLRQRFCDIPPDDLRLALGGNAAALYGFDLDALAPLAAAHGPTVGEVATPLDALPEHPNEALLRP